MKKLLIAFLILLAVPLSIVCATSSYYFVWENTQIDIPVGDALDNYLLLPKATLYLDGSPTNHYVGMLWGEDDTDPDYIDTSVVGTYKLTYRAVSDIEEKTTVLFNVKDFISPVVNQIQDISVPAFSKPNYSAYFTYSDNYYSKSDLTITYNDLNVNYNIPGKYHLFVSVTDKSENTTTLDAMVEVRVLESPKYKEVSKVYEISYGKEFIIGNYYKAYDCFDKDISSKIKSSEVDTRKIDGSVTSDILSTQLIDFSVSDDYGNETKWSQMFYIVDKEPPKISFYKDRVVLNVGQVDDINKETFMSYVESVTDNLDIKEIDIAYSSVKKAVGEYEVVYSVCDYAGNTTSKSLYVNVECDAYPIITVSKDIKITKGGSVNYYNYFTSIDKYDGDITLDAVIDDRQVNYNRKGIYFVYITSTNSYGKHSFQTITVTVRENFFKEYYYLFLLPVGVGLVVAFLIIKKKKSVI